MEHTIKNLRGLPDSHDRQWILHTPEFDAMITDYNWELTGYDTRLYELDPDIFHYGGNAYYITGRYSNERGWTAEVLDYVRP